MRRLARTRNLSAVAAFAAVVLVAAASAVAAVRVSTPAITSFAPLKAKPAAKVTVAGTNFKGATAVKVDGMKMKYTVVSPTKIVITLSTKAKSGQITVTTSHGTATSSKQLSVT